MNMDENAPVWAHFPDDHRVSLVYCLIIDLIKSTEAGLELSTAMLDRFNLSLVDQIKPHLLGLGLADVLTKFTGDGWLLMTEDVGKVPALCCLAIIMSNRFKVEISENTGLALDRIPSLRLAVCSGRDMAVQTPDGRIDWVGDSARRAVRATGCCLPNEILIDVPVRYNVFRDFNLTSIAPEELNSRNQGKLLEEIFPLYVLG